MSDPLRLYLLGPFRLERAGQSIRLPTRKAESLLAYLALQSKNTRPSRERLAALFWGDSPDQLARSSLRRALVLLRQALGDGLLLADRETIQINPDYPLWVDADKFQVQAQHLLKDVHGGPNSLEVGLYRDDLLVDFYDEWIPPLREHFQALFLESLLRMGEQARTRGEYERAVQLAQTVLQRDAANETAHQQLMFSYWKMGRRSAALSQFIECERLLRKEVGAEPTGETKALYQRIRQDLPPSAPAPETPVIHLPSPLTAFIGREREIDQVCQAFSATRLLTLTGAGGMGKTRLAIQVGRELLKSFDDGTWWVELAALADEGLVAQQVADALQVQRVALEPPEDTIAQYLHAKRLLLVLDNCEHLVQACAQLAERLLSACPDLKILATSREPLGLTGETVWRVPSLTLASLEPHPSAELGRSEAVRLWVDRARAVQPGFEMTEQNAAAVALICRRLDGIPLAIELAAARLRALSVQQIAARLDDRFQLLTIGSRTALPRHQTLRALIDWSYDLLSQAEQTLLRRLSVFAGGWTLEAAEEVCAGADLPRSQVLDPLSHLVDRSLVVAEERGGATRYGFLETIRQYADEKLHESGEIGPLHHRHLAYFLGLVEEEEPRLCSAARLSARSRLEADWDNLRAALAWSQTAEDGEMEMRLAGALYEFWREGNNPSEGQRFLDHALLRAQDGRPNSAVLAKLLLGLGNLARTEDALATARLRVLESTRLFRELGDKRHAALALVRLGWLCAQEGDHAEARAYLEESVALAREVGDKWPLLAALSTLGDILQHAELPGARPVLEESLALAHELGDERIVASVLIFLSEIDLRQGDYAIAWSRREQALALSRENGRKINIALALGALGDLARLQGDYARARVLYEEAMPLWEGDVFGVGWILQNLGDVALYYGDATRAAELFKESLDHHKRAGEREYMAEALAGLAGVAAAVGQPEPAARLFGAAEALRDGTHLSIRVYNRAPYDRYWPMAQASSDEATLNRAWAEGKVMSLEQAIDYALTGAMPPL